MKRHRTVRQTAHELPHYFRRIGLQLLRRAARDHLALREQKLASATVEIWCTSWETTTLVMPSASFKRRISRNTTPREIGSRPTKGSS